MIVSDDRLSRIRLHPLHGILLAALIPLFLGGLLSDMAYAYTYQIQWSNFASWLIAGGLLFGAGALLWAILAWLFTARHGGYAYPVLLALTWVIGLFNALVHAKDAWAIMPMGFILSLIVVLLACASNWIAFVKFGVGGRR